MAAVVLSAAVVVPVVAALAIPFRNAAN